MDESAILGYNWKIAQANAEYFNCCSKLHLLDVITY